MRLRLRIAFAATLATLSLAAGASANAASGARLCTWGGTPAAPTGTFTITPGNKNTPSPVPMKFTATGPLAGGCSGTLSFSGYFNAGTSCLLASGAGSATGLPGVVRYGGIAPVEPGAFPPLWLYNGRGQIVGSEQPNVLTDTLLNQPNACSTPQGLTSGKFDSLIELFGGR